MDTTPNLHLPYILAAQAQKHVTHNEALRALDALVQLSVLDRDLATPPGSPVNGQCYIVAASPTGAWEGHALEVAAFQDEAWAFFAPLAGWLAWVADEAQLYAWNGSAWVVASDMSVKSAPQVGVNTTADATNKLAVKSDAVLISHDDVTPGSGDIQIKANKSAAARTASLLYQTGFSGRAEMGTTGDDQFRFKVSSDGASWKTAIRLDAATGRVQLGADTTPTDVMTVTNPVGIGGYAQIARFNVWNTPDASQLSRILLGQQTTNAFFIEVADQANTKGNWIFQPYGGKLAMRTWRTIPSDVDISLGGPTAPDVDNAYSCGTATRRWSTIYAANGTINTSDARDKEVERPLGPMAGEIVDRVEPVLFRWRVGGVEVVESGTKVVGHDPDGRPVEQPASTEVERPGRRLHAGFRAQDVKAAMDAAAVDFGAWGLDDKDDPESRQWIRPEQLIPILWQAVRELRAELRQRTAA